MTDLRSEPGADSAHFEATPRGSTETAGQTERASIWHGWAAVDLSLHRGSNLSRLASIAQNIRVLRSLAPESPVTVRDEELSIIGSVLDLHQPDLVPQIMSEFLLSRDEAQDLLARIYASSNPTPPAPPGHRI